MWRTPNSAEEFRGQKYGNERNEMQRMAKAEDAKTIIH